MQPHAAAPDLMGFLGNDDQGHCFFMRQPVTSQDMQQAVASIRASCCGAVRYGGNDPEVLRTLRAVGRKDSCDNG
jgi:hypothetical protein